MMKFKNTRFFVLILTLSLFAFAGCGKKGHKPNAPNIILITIDTLRADHLSCYGYPRQTSPFIDSIARESTVFTGAYSTSSWTAPSMASIFTGLYPRGHGVVHGVAQGPSAAITGQEMLVNDFATMAEIFKKAGYTTFGVSSNGHISRGTGFGQGFDYFDIHWFMKSPASNLSVKKWLNPIRKASRYFLWIHYFDPHNPYAPRLPWYRAYIAQSNSYSKWLREVMPNPKEFIEELKTDANGLNVLKDRYDSEINYCDYYIKELFALLQPGENTLVIITADHGEAFLEHGQLLHGDTLFEEEIRIPLIIKVPGKNKTAKTLPQVVSNRDILATLVDFTGMKPGVEIPGKSLMSLISGASTVAPEYICYELDWNGWAKGVRCDNWKLLLTGHGEKEMFLFDIQVDPSEQQNLVGRQPDQVRLLESRLNEWLSVHPEFKAPKIRLPVDKNQEDKLRTLGYIQ
jgi:arylsulfatase A-like enzyme